MDATALRQRGTDVAAVGDYTGVLSSNFFVKRSTRSARCPSSAPAPATRTSSAHDDPGSLPRQRPLELAHLLRGVRSQRGADRCGRAERGAPGQPERDRERLLLPVDRQLGSHSIVAASTRSRTRARTTTTSRAASSASTRATRSSGAQATTSRSTPSSSGQDGHGYCRLYLLWTPLASPARQPAAHLFRFLNDQWRLSNKWTFNVGVRWDKVDETDQQGNQVANGSEFSPRLSASFDLKGDGQWTINAGLPGTSCGDQRHRGPGFRGRPDLELPVRLHGPAINADSIPEPGLGPRRAQDRLRLVLRQRWHEPPYRSNPRSWPDRTIGGTLDVPSTWEYSLGFAASSGRRARSGSMASTRDYEPSYTDQVLLASRCPTRRGRKFDLNTIVTTNDLDRKYKALMGQVQYRFTPEFTLGGNYTLSRSYGNVNNENESSGPCRTTTCPTSSTRTTVGTRPSGPLDRPRHKSASGPPTT